MDVIFLPNILKQIKLSPSSGTNKFCLVYVHNHMYLWCNRKMVNLSSKICHLRKLFLSSTVPQKPLFVKILFLFLFSLTQVIFPYILVLCFEKLFVFYRKVGIFFFFLINVIKTIIYMVFFRFNSNFYFVIYIPFYVFKIFIFLRLYLAINLFVPHLLIVLSNFFILSISSFNNTCTFKTL